MYRYGNLNKNKFKTKYSLIETFLFSALVGRQYARSDRDTV